MDHFEVGDFADADRLDVDGDGTDDTVSVQLDDPDETPEALFTDSDGDGFLDAGWVDTDNDGVADLYVHDGNEDGQLDVIDADFDGIDDAAEAARATATVIQTTSTSSGPIELTPSATSTSSAAPPRPTPSTDPSSAVSEAATPSPGYDPANDDALTQKLLNDQIISTMFTREDTTSDLDGDGVPDYLDSDKYADQYHDLDGDGRPDDYDRDKYADDVHDRDGDGTYDGYDRDKYDSTYD